MASLLRLIRPHLVALLALASLPLGCDSTDSGSAVTLNLRGTVREAPGGAPVSGAEVYLVGLTSPETVVLLSRAEAAADGSYALSLRLPGAVEDEAGACTVEYEGERIAVEVQGLDGAGLFGSATPRCTTVAQVVDLELGA